MQKRNERMHGRTEVRTHACTNFQADIAYGVNFAECVLNMKV